MVYLVAGYKLEFTDAEAWMAKRRPDFTISPKHATPYLIKREMRAMGLPVNCMAVEYPLPSPHAVCLFPVYDADDRASTVGHFRRFKEGDRAKRVRELLFGEYAAMDCLKGLEFVTIADPYQVHSRF
jgi:hypothetical protein